MPIVKSNGVDIAYESYGVNGHPVLLMVQGLGMPLSAWPPEFIHAFVAAGFHVVTFDNRDIGRSELLDHLGVPNLLLQTLRMKLGFNVRAPYQLEDMMRDAIGLMDALQIDAAHVVGISMGGMIAQLLAIHHLQRVKSLTSIMSTTGRRSLRGPTRDVLRHFRHTPRNGSQAAKLEFHRKMWRLIGSPAYPMSDEHLEQFLARIFERGMSADGTSRQTLATMAAKSRVEALAKLEVPTLIIHGDSDPLVRFEAGQDTAQTIPGARFVAVEGMGHDLPQVLLPQLTSRISEHAMRAETNGETSPSGTG